MGSLLGNSAMRAGFRINDQGVREIQEHLIFNHKYGIAIANDPERLQEYIVGCEINYEEGNGLCFYIDSEFSRSFEPLECYITSACLSLRIFS